MTPNVAYAVAQTTIGLGLETTKGTPSTNVSWIPVKGPKYKPNLDLISDDTLQGSMVSTYSMIPGLRYDSHGWDGYPRLDTFPLFLRGVLGSSDTNTDPAVSDTLSSAAAVGDTTLKLTTALAAGDWVTLGSGVTTETHYITSIATTTATLLHPVRFAHASGAAVNGLAGHEFSLLNDEGQGNQPPSFTIQDYDGNKWRQLTSSQLSKLTIKGNATGAVEYTVEWAGDAATTISAPLVAFSTAQPTPGWTTQVSLGGTPVNFVEDWEIDFDRGLQEIPALTGSQNYYLHYAGPLAATGKLTVVEQADSSLLTQFESGATQALDLTVADIHSGYAMTIHCSQMVFSSGSLERSKAYVEAQADMTLLPSTSDATSGGVSPVIVRVGNDQDTAY